MPRDRGSGYIPRDRGLGTCGGSNKSMRVRKCFVYGKESCWSTNYTKEEVIEAKR
jgi:hypothetical protein